MADRESIDWGALVRDAQIEGVASILYDLVRGQALVPRETEETLRLAYYETARRNLIRFHEVETVIARCNQRSIPVIVLKGAAFAETVYENIALRPMVDVDLLIREDDLPEALDVLTSMGYQRDENAGFSSLADVHANEITVRKPKVRESTIELHWSLFWFPFYQQTVPMPWFWETRRAVTLRETPAWGLGLEAQIIHVCGHLLHHQATEDTYRLLWLYDIASLIHRYQADIDWDVLMDYGLRFNLVLPIRSVLMRVHELWNPPIPQVVIDQVKGWQAPEDELRAHTWLQRVGSSFEAYAVASVMGLPDLWSRGRFVWRTMLFPSANFMKNRYCIKHPRLLPFYYPYRWLQGAARALSLLF
jgi:hypothetical protein